MPSFHQGDQLVVHYPLYLTDQGWQRRSDIPVSERKDGLPVVEAGAVLHFSHLFWIEGVVQDDEVGLNFFEIGKSKHNTVEFSSREFPTLMALGYLERIG